MNTHHVIKNINLIEHYDPISGTISGPVGALPIQTPVSPDGKNMVTANTLTGTITIIDTRPNLATTDEVVAMLAAIPVATACNTAPSKGVVTMPMFQANSQTECWLLIQTLMVMETRPMPGL